jgi:hypothetical protein
MQFISLYPMIIITSLLLRVMKITKYKNEIIGKYTHHPHN